MILFFAENIDKNTIGQHSIFFVCCSSEEESEDSVQCLPRRMLNREPVIAGAHCNTKSSLTTNFEASGDLSKIQIGNISGVSVHVLHHCLTYHSFA